MSSRTSGIFSHRCVGRDAGRERARDERREVGTACSYSGKKGGMWIDKEGRRYVGR